MFLTIVILAIIMAVFAVLGYLHGARASAFLTLVILLGLLLLARAGGTVARLINGIYFGMLFVLNGGLQALSAADRSAAVSAVFQKIGSATLINANSPGPELILILLILIVIALWLGRRPRFWLYGPTSIWGFFFGLLNGYLLGAYLLVSVFPAEAGFLPLPFGLGGSPAAAVGPGAATNGDLVNRFITGVLSAPEQTLAVLVMVIIALFVILGLLVGSRRGSRSSRNGTS
jgi:hypothetical protein